MRPDLSTVYRALDFLVKADRVQSISLGRTAYFFGANSTGCGHFLSCEHCHEIVNIEECVSTPLQKQLENETHYCIHRHLLYFEGLCPDCQLVLKKREAAS